MRFFFLLLINYFDNVMMKLIANNRTDALKTDVKLIFKTTNCQINRSRSLTCPINYNFMCLFSYWQWKLASERPRISAVKYISIRTIWHRNLKPHSHSCPAVSVKIIIDGRKIHFWYFVSINIAELKVALIQTYIQYKHWTAVPQQGERPGGRAAPPPSFFP